MNKSADLIIAPSPKPKKVASSRFKKMTTSKPQEDTGWSFKGIANYIKQKFGWQAPSAGPEMDFESFESDELSAPHQQIRLDEGWDKFSVSGSGITIAVIDSGCRKDHDGFEDENGESRVVEGISFLGNSLSTDTGDDHGHGTFIAGIIAAGLQYGIAPDAKILPLKVYSKSSDPEETLGRIVEALNWLVSNGTSRGVSVVNLSMGNSENYKNSNEFPAELTILAQQIKQAIQTLKNKKIPVVIASGNYYKTHGSAQGMNFPAIMPDAISVGAVHSSEEESGETYSEYGGAQIIDAAMDIVAPFTQRLPKKSGEQHFTRFLAPGAPVESLGHEETTDIISNSGTSVAAPMVSGVIALMQEKEIKEFGSLPDCALIERWLESGAISIHDMNGTHDNVQNTDKNFARLDVLGALEAMDDRSGAGT